ncbi:MAG TPA: hypothetical protein VHJ78_09220 [Actinomycetota bacterium]|nr:hypothetical protein [Actinomycetota bacterium]
MAHNMNRTNRRGGAYALGPAPHLLNRHAKSMLSPMRYAIPFDKTCGSR